MASSPSKKKSLHFRATPLALVCLALFTVLAIATAKEAPFLISMEEGIVRWVHSIRVQPLTTFFSVATQLGSTAVITVLTISSVLVLVAKKRANDAIFVGLSVVMTVAFSQLFKHLLTVPRPPQEFMLAAQTGHSFPSGHTACALALYISLAIIVAHGFSSQGRQIALYVGAALLVILVGISRIYLGVHWASDVVGAALLAGSLLCSFYDKWVSGFYRDNQVS